MAEQNILIRYQADTTELEAAIDLLEKTGQIDKETADSYRRANAAYKERNKVLEENTKKQRASNKATKDANKDVKDLSKSVNNLSRLAKRGAGALAGFFAARQFIQITKGLVNLGVEIESTGVKFDTVFGEAGRQIEKFAKDNAAAMGLSVNEYKKATAAAGDLLIPIGFQRQEAATLSNDLVRLSGALAAWTGGQFNATQVSEILTKALLGEREQLKQLGINILESDVKARIAAKGLDKLTGASLAQAKAAATLELITLKSKDAQTAFSDETQTLAEKQLELRAEFRTLAEDIATDLIPIYDNLLETLKSEEFKEFASGLVEVLKTFIRLVGQSAQGWGIFINGVRNAINPQREYTKLTFEELTARKALIRSRITELKQIKEETGGNIILSRELAEQQEALQRVNKEIASRVDRGRRFVTQVEEEEEVIEDLTESLGPAAGSIADLQKRIKELNKTIAETSPDDDVYADLLAQVIALEKALEKAVKRVEDLKDAIGGTRSIIDLTGEEDPRTAAELIMDTYDELVKRRTAKEDEFQEKLLGDNELVGLETAKRIRERLDFEREAGLSTVEIFEKTAGSASNILGQFTATANAFSQARLAQVEQDLANGLITEKEAARIRAEILRREAIFNKITTGAQVAIQTALNVVKAVGDPFALAEAIAVGALQAAAVAATAIPPIPSFRTGTKNTPAGMIRVGEAGEELLVQKGGAAVIPNADARRILAKWDVPSVPPPGYGMPGLSPEQIREIHAAGTDIDYQRLAKALSDTLSEDLYLMIQASVRGSKAIRRGIDRSNVILKSLTTGGNAYQSRV